MFWKNSLDVRSSVFLRVAFENPFSGANFCFSCLVVASCFLVAFFLCFCFMFRLFAPGHVLENSLDVRSSLFLRVPLRINFRERTFVFLVLLWLLVFLVVVAYVFALCFGFSLQDTFWKNSLDVRSSLLWGRIFGPEIQPESGNRKLSLV